MKSPVARSGAEDVGDGLVPGPPLAPRDVLLGRGHLHAAVPLRSQDLSRIRLRLGTFFRKSSQLWSPLHILWRWSPMTTRRGARRPACRRTSAACSHPASRHRRGALRLRTKLNNKSNFYFHPFCEKVVVNLKPVAPSSMVYSSTKGVAIA